MSPEQVRHRLNYDASTGSLTWRVSLGRATIGKRAGYTAPSGYVFVRMNGKNYPAHRLAWVCAHGRWPDKHLDHVNGDPSDNRLANLRACTHAENHQNAGLRKDNRERLTGVSLHRHSGLYAAEIKVKGVRHHLGYHRTREAARAAYVEAKARLHRFQPAPRGTPVLYAQPEGACSGVRDGGRAG